jgi:hypothetical protein
LTGSEALARGSGVGRTFDGLHHHMGSAALLDAEAAKWLLGCRLPVGDIVVKEISTARAYVLVFAMLG